MFRWLAAAFVLVCSGTVFAAACGGGGGNGPRLTAEEYFSRVQLLYSAANARYDEIGRQLGTAASPADALTKLQQVYPERVATIRDLLSGIEALRPPKDADKAQSAAVDALHKYATVEQTNGNAIASATTMQQAGAVLNSQASNDATAAASAACNGLVQSASGHGITLDLKC